MIIDFGKKLYKEVNEDNLSSIACELTYKLLLAIFPFLIFAFAILGFLELDSKIIIDMAGESMPKEAMNIINVFMSEVIDSKSPGILSTSLLLSIISSSSGFLSVINGINKSYGFQDKRNFIVKRLVSILLVFAFVFAMIVSILLLIFGDSIEKLLLSLNLLPENILNAIFGFSSYLFSLLIMLLIVMVIFKLALGNKVNFLSLMPGALVTVLLWVISSKLFNIYVNNFGKYSKVYGSIGSIFVLMLWLNLIAFFLLFGSEINAVLMSYKNNANPEKNRLEV